MKHTIKKGAIKITRANIKKNIMENQKLPFPEVTDAVENIQNATELSKAAINKLAVTQSEDILDNGDPLEAYIKAKALEKFCQELMKKIKEAAITEAGKYTRDDAVILGVDFAVTRSATVYDYDGCNFTPYQDVVARKKLLEQIMKESDGSLVDEDSGEPVPKAKVKSGGDETLKITIK